MLNAVFLLEGGREVSMQTFVGPWMRNCSHLDPI